MNLLLPAQLNSSGSYFWILILKDPAPSASRHIQPDKLCRLSVGGGKSSTTRRKGKRGQVSLTCQDRYVGCGMPHERILNKYHSKIAFLLYGTPHIYLSFLARKGDNVDITGISEIPEGQHHWTLEHTDFACTKVKLVILKNNTEQRF